MRETFMIVCMNDLTDLPHWHRKIFDPGFTFEWKSARLLTAYDVTPSMLDWCIEEVKHRAQDYIHSRIISAIDGGVLKSDTCTATSTRIGLSQAIAPLRSQQLSAVGQKDDPVIDVVDPYLFPFQWTRTRCGDGEVVEMPPKEDCRQDEFSKYRNDEAWSRRYQWLPFNVRFEDDGRGRSRIDGYVSNVHPSRHSDLYAWLEVLIDDLLPLFNRTLVDLKAPGYQNQRIHLVCFGRDPFIKREPDFFQPPEQRAYSNYRNHEGQYKSSIFVDLKREFWNIGVQMILQIRDINLTPSRPIYDGEDWHVQGQTNERICASAMYIYSTSNISTTTGSYPTVSFRRRVFPEEAIAAKGEITTPPFLPQIYGAKHGDPVIQRLGDVVLRENRVVVWPNVFQTRLNGFKLEDKEKEGHLRLVTLHLIDPNRRIMSTAMVPCQRRDWWADAVRRTSPVLYRLPTEIFQHIIQMIDDGSYPISVDQGERDSDDFKQQRELFRQKHTAAMDGYDDWDFYGEPGVGDGDDGE
ncbi:MAG: hypothetical protein LQ344_001954 [Seirophora lacunosa]|nr:MAG: hypothetical protein LQ344_001954 [Seirophora lacunosa]